MKSKYRILESDSRTQGDLFEFVDNHFFDVIDSSTGEILMTFQNEYSREMDGSQGWKNQSEQGVEKVILTDDGRTITYYCFGSAEPVNIQLPV